MAPAVSLFADGRTDHISRSSSKDTQSCPATQITIKLILLTLLLLVSAVTCLGQSTTGTVSMSATVSKFVEINSGGAVTLTGNSGGGVTTDGVTNSPLAVSINLGELGPSNTNSFVTASVPLKLRSNAAYVLSMSATVTSSGTHHQQNRCC